MNVAALVLNRNMREMTESLIDSIRQTTHDVEVTIFNIDADSDADEVTRNADHNLMLRENNRWAWSFHEAIKSIWFNGEYNFDHYWCLCNDAQIVDDGTLDRLVADMPPATAQIHPYQKSHPATSAQGKRGSGVRNTSFVEFVCPLLSGSFVRSCFEEFKMPGISKDFMYGWGVDYEMAYLGHRLGFKSYIHQDVGILHQPGTTHINHEKAKVEPNEEMRKKARNNMLYELERRYGIHWGEVFAEGAREAGVDPKDFLEWSSYDRMLSVSGARA